MAILEKIRQMQRDGKSESEIINELKELGIHPREISEALSQARIKSALESQQMQKEAFSDPNQPGYGEGMQPSIMPSIPQPSVMEYQEYPGMTNEYPAQEQSMGYQSETQGYPEYQQYQPAQQFDLEAINEITEQIVIEKTGEMKRQISSIEKIKRNLQLDVEKIEQRLIKLENMFNDLQMAILNKIGEYGTDLREVSEELRQTQKSFSKVVGPATENIRELQKIAKPGKHDKKEKRESKSSASFEDYLR